METGQTSNKSDDSISKQVINEYNGKTFEKNIRRSLEYYFGFEKLEHSHIIFKKKITYDINKEIEILQNEETTINIQDNNYKLLFDKSHGVIIKDENGHILNTIDSKYSNKETTETINGTNIIIKISPYQEMEIDGLIKINSKFSVHLFNENEISILYNTVKDEDTFAYVIIEAKLSPKKVNDLIKQIKRDNGLLNLLKKKPAVILGFINSDSVKDKSHLKSLKNVKCVVYGVKNSELFGKDITQPIDWGLCKTVDDLKTKFDDLKTEFNDFKGKVDLIYNYIISRMDQEKDQSGKKEEKEEKEKNIFKENKSKKWRKRMKDHY